MIENISIQWTLVTLFLAAEIIFVISMLLPIISPTKWKQIFNSQLIEFINRKSHLFFNFVLVILTVFLCDAIREMFKYENITEESRIKGTPEMVNAETVREFRSQRNVYMCGMSLFLWFVIKRLVVLLTSNADLAEDYEFKEKECLALKRELDTLLESKLRLSAQTIGTDESSPQVDTSVDSTGKETSEIRSRSRSKTKKEM